MMKKILILCLAFSLAAPSFANEIICPTNTSEIENQIASNWHKSGGPWYSSWAQVQMGTFLGTGGVRGPIDNGMPSPQKQKPELRYTSLVIQDDHDRGQKEIDCQYLIVHNPEVFSYNFPSLSSLDNIFMMIVFLDEADKCKKVSNTTVVCT